MLRNQLTWPACGLTISAVAARSPADACLLARAATQDSFLAAACCLGRFCRTRTSDARTAIVRLWKRTSCCHGVARDSNRRSLDTAKAVNTAGLNISEQPVTNGLAYSARYLRARMLRDSQLVLRRPARTAARAMVAAAWRWLATIAVAGTAPRPTRGVGAGWARQNRCHANRYLSTSFRGPVLRI